MLDRIEVNLLQYFGVSDGWGWFFFLVGCEVEISA